MESLLSGTSLSEELAFLKKHIALVSSQHIKYNSQFVPPLEHRPKKATLAEVPVCAPPTAKNDDEPAPVATITLTIKSSKPPLLFTLACPSTSTILTLKSLLCERETTAPPLANQRWLLKGKAMGDAKLLREFEVKDGDVVNLMVSKASAPAVPELTLTSDATDNSIPALSLVIPPPEAETKVDSFNSRLAAPQLWKDAYAILKKQYGGDENQARRAWELWLDGSIAFITPSEKAMIRESVGNSAMGGV